MAPPTLIAIENVGQPRGPETIHLEHDVYCVEAGDCRCSRRNIGVPRFDADKQARVTERQNQRIPTAITLNAAGTKGSRVEDLHPAVLKTADAQRLLAMGRIRQAKPAVPKVEPAAQAAPPADKVAPVAPTKPAKKPLPVDPKVSDG